MEDWCRICRKFYPTRSSTYKRATFYCTKCSSMISTNNNAFNRYLDSDTFLRKSFDDVCGDRWLGFKDVVYDDSIPILIEQKFPCVRLVVSFHLDKRKQYTSLFRDKSLYLCSNRNILKVGQTTNPASRLPHYYIFGNPKIDLFEVDTWELQDLMEHKIRNYLEYLGHLLPNDNSGNRLKYIQEVYNV